MFAPVDARLHQHRDVTHGEDAEGRQPAGGRQVYPAQIGARQNLRQQHANDESEQHDVEHGPVETVENHLAPGMTLGNADDHRRDDSANGAEGEQMHRHRADPDEIDHVAKRLDQQLADDGQVADVHDADVDASESQLWFPVEKTDDEQGGQQ